MKFLGVVVNDVVVAAVKCNGNGLTTTTDRLLSQPFRFWGLSIMNVVSQFNVCLNSYCTFSVFKTARNEIF